MHGRVWLVIAFLGLFAVVLYLTDAFDRVDGQPDQADGEGVVAESSPPAEGESSGDAGQSADDAPESYDQLPVGELEAFTQGAFVPYWSDLSSVAEADPQMQLWYFGVVPSVDGLRTDEAGYRGLAPFTEAATRAGNQNQWLTLRMVDSSLAAEIFSTAASWQKIADDTITVVDTYGFTGVVLNLEVGLQAFASSEADITAFSAFLADEFTAAGIPMAMTLYGDTKYRARPYDLAALDEVSDSFLVMTYDFHKSFGLPGPNFPLHQGGEYAYDLEMMLDDLTNSIPARELTVVFGMYGYEWVVDDQDRPIKQATAVTVNEVAAYREQCQSDEACTIVQDPVSAETQIRLPGDDGRTRVIWYEDQQSVARKLPVLEQYGIDQVGFWAWGYW